jgi:Arc/MetJ family transcription regulator
VYVGGQSRCIVGRVIKRTNINLDTQLVREAADLLGTTRTSDTVHAAMRDVVARAHRRRLAERDLFGDVTAADLDAMRRPRAVDG